MLLKQYLKNIIRVHITQILSQISKNPGIHNESQEKW